MIFLSSSPDGIGIIAKISSFFAERGINIAKLEEHTEQGRFFLRLETEGEFEIPQISQEFLPLAGDLQMDFQMLDEQKRPRMLLFCSDTLHCPLAIFSHIFSGLLSADIVGVVSNSQKIEDFCKKMEIPFFYTPAEKGSFAHEEGQLQIISTLSPDVIVLARYMKVISENFLFQVSVPIINIHHSFLPSFIGGTPYEMAYKRGVKLIGATAHLVTKDLDEGPIIAQKVLPVSHEFSVLELKKYGASIEQQTLVEAVQKFCERKILEYRGRTIIF
ncbi:MAG: formyltetrahydrofolate deformylase [Candidatus Peregrinibacteria bacterium]